MKFIKLIKQHDEKDCGAACLSMILDFYGRKVPVSKIRQVIKVDRNGANIYGIMDGAAKYHMTSEALQGSPKEAWDNIVAGEYVFPFIIRILNDYVYEHFAVVAGTKEKKLVLLDPAKGRRSMSEEEFSKCFLGQLINFTPDKNFVKKKEGRSNYFNYFQLIARQKGLLVTTVVLSMGIMGIGISGMYLFKYIVDSVISNISIESTVTENIETLYLFVLAISALYLVRYGLTLLRSKLMAHLSRNVDLPLMLGYYNHVTGLPLSFFNTLKTGELMSRFEDAAKIRDAISGSLITITLDSFLVIGCGIALYIQSQLLFRITLFIFIAYFVVAMVFVKPLAKSNEVVMEKNAELTSFLKESFDGIEAVKSMRSEGIVQEKTAKIYHDFMNINIKKGLLNIRKEALIDLITSIGTLCVLWNGTMQVIEGNITVGVLITYTSLMNCFLDPIQDLVQLQGNVETAIVAADRLNDILIIEKERSDGATFETEVYKIEFDHVDFRYGNRNLILRDFSMEILEGQRIALIGESGCGKSTAAKLIMGLYDPERGNIRVNDTEISSFSVDYLRSQIAYVPQSTYLFTGTVRDNLFMGAHQVDWDEKDIEQVLDICQCQFIKKLPFGINSEIEENGSNLSGGQKQRIAIARALLGRPSVLILDESTSALDAISEYRILKGIRDMYPHLTIITVTHRIKSVVDYDRIHIIEDGKISGSGVHGELLANNPMYARLWSLQEEYYCKNAS